MHRPAAGGGSIEFFRGTVGQQMPSTITSAFSDPADFQAALQKCGVVEFIPKRTDAFQARLTQIRLIRLELLAGGERVPRLAVVTPPAGHVLITFPKKDGGIQIWDEFAVRPGELVAMSRGYNCWRIVGPTRWGAVMMLADSLAEYSRAVFGRHAKLPGPDLSRWRPRRQVFAQLLKLHHAAICRTIRQPEAPIDAEAGRGLEQGLIAALLDSLRSA